MGPATPEAPSIIAYPPAISKGLDCVMVYWKLVVGKVMVIGSYTVIVTALL